MVARQGRVVKVDRIAIAVAGQQAPPQRRTTTPETVSARCDRSTVSRCSRLIRPSLFNTS
jgi:hypothetical protein